MIGVYGKLPKDIKYRIAFIGPDRKEKAVLHTSTYEEVVEVVTRMKDQMSNKSFILIIETL